MKAEETMSTIYVYVLDTLADWELGHVTSELNSGRFFKQGAQRVSLKTVSYSKEPIITMGGLTILPNCSIDMAVDESSMLLLPGADTWNDPKHAPVIQKAGEFLSLGAAVCAICGATAALASVGLLDRRPHTSNGPGFLEMVSPGYKGQDFYIDKPSVADGSLITAAIHNNSPSGSSPKNWNGLPRPRQQLFPGIWLGSQKAEHRAAAHRLKRCAFFFIHTLAFILLFLYNPFKYFYIYYSN